MPKVKIYGKLQPYKWQSDVHNYITGYLSHENRAAETIVIKAARQRFGKSAFTKAELIRFALNRSGSLNAYVTPKLALARKMFKELVKSTSDFITNKNMIDMIIEYNNGSVIRFHSEQQGEGLRGFTVTGILVIDEGSSFKDDTFYEYISPWVTVHKALTIIISTPKYKIGFFYDCFLKGLNADNTYYRTFDWVCNYHVPIPPEDLDKKSQMPLMKWKSEYEGVFLDAEGSVFGDFSGCFIDGHNRQFTEVYLGLDFGTGSGKDYTVLTGLDENGKQLFIWAVNDMSPIEQIDHITEMVKAFKGKVKAFVAEQNSIGKVYLDGLKKKGLTVDKFTTTENSKRSLVEDLQVAIQNKTIRLLKDQAQTQELSFYESTVNPRTQKVSYGAPVGMHDDRAMALMLAWRAYKRKITKYYNIHIT